MTVRQPRYSKEEFARRGDEIYESQVRSQVEAGNHGKIVATDIETRDLKSIGVKLRLAIASKLATRMPKSGSSALALVTFVDLADGLGELYPLNLNRHITAFRCSVVIPR